MLISAPFVVFVVVFLVVYMTLGGPTTTLLGMEATLEAIADPNVQLGFDRLFSVQYTGWLMDMLHGDWGQPYFLQTIVLGTIGEYSVSMFNLTVFAQLISLVITVPVGILTAYRRGISVDTIVILISLLGIAVPGFLPSMSLMLFFGIHPKWFPMVGYVQLSRGLLEYLRYSLLPALSPGVVQATYITHMPRSAMLDVFYMNYIRTVRAKGLGESTVAPVYDLKDAGPTILTVVGQSFSSPVTGATVIETLFSIPGLDMLTMTSITRRDVFVAQGVVLFVILIYVLVSLMANILYGFVDPRTQLGNRQGGKLRRC